METLFTSDTLEAPKTYWDDARSLMDLLKKAGLPRMEEARLGGSGQGKH